ALSGRKKAQASAKIEPARPRGVRCLSHELPHPPPVVNRLCKVASERPSCGPIVPAGGFQRLASGFPVLREERGVLVEPVAIQIGNRPRDFGVDALPPLAELRAVRYFLRQRMLERILGLGTRSLLVDQLRRGESLQHAG